jgi:hypothetical protein
LFKHAVLWNRLLLFMGTHSKTTRSPSPSAEFVAWPVSNQHQRMSTNASIVDPEWFLRKLLMACQQWSTEQRTDLIELALSAIGTSVSLDAGALRMYVKLCVKMIQLAPQIPAGDTMHRWLSTCVNFSILVQDANEYFIPLVFWLHYGLFSLALRNDFRCHSTLTGMLARKRKINRALVISNLMILRKQTSPPPSPPPPPPLAEPVDLFIAWCLMFSAPNVKMIDVCTKPERKYAERYFAAAMNHETKTVRQQSIRLLQRTLLNGKSKKVFSTYFALVTASSTYVTCLPEYATLSELAASSSSSYGDSKSPALRSLGGSGGGSSSASHKARNLLPSSAKTALQIPTSEAPNEAVAERKILSLDEPETEDANGEGDSDVDMKSASSAKPKVKRSSAAAGLGIDTFSPWPSVEDPLSTKHSSSSSTSSSSGSRKKRRLDSDSSSFSSSSSATAEAPKRPWPQCLYNSPELSDCTIVCGQTRWYAHKVVLYGISEFFVRLSKSPMAENNTNNKESELDLSVYPVQTVRAFLLHAYKFDPSHLLSDMNSVVTLFDFAITYQIDALRLKLMSVLLPLLNQLMNESMEHSSSQTRWQQFLKLVEVSMKDAERLVVCQHLFSKLLEDERHGGFQTIFESLFPHFPKIRKALLEEALTYVFDWDV